MNDLNDEGSKEITMAYEPQTYERLIEVKTKYDPDIIFHLNQNVKPRNPAHSG